MGQALFSKCCLESSHIKLQHQFDSFFSFVTKVVLFVKQAQYYEVFNSKLITYGICRDQINHPQYTKYYTIRQCQTFICG